MYLVIDYNTTCSVKFCADSIYIAYLEYIIGDVCACTAYGKKVYGPNESVWIDFQTRIKNSPQHQMWIRHAALRPSSPPSYSNNTHRQTSTHIHTLSSRRRKPVILAFQGPLPRSQSPRPGPASSCSRPSVAGALMQRHAAAPI